MDRSPLNSSYLKSVAYDMNSQTLEIEFHNGSICQYLEVPSVTHSTLMLSSSQGTYFKENIKNSYSKKKIR
ncbi:hypothetical protein MBCUT_18070 [Methanobrevibacter cuticularis]|uniref:KTSC domain-containing protein n=1 Tax=Methanobrevibacter cuticularis TaxID=47311 RepID=A0A166CYQ9_9EURY|nr:KTSC domain-containing protein [Methanobrevibacter cuticularis]KZX15005.1 hypothetical protein MBCUT_18070 [Methanobrevibacter cuticularis]